MADPCVVNITKRAGRRPAWDVYVGRGPCPCRARACSHGPTGWGNPYTVERDGPLAMVLYVDHLEQRLWAQPAFGQALDQLDGKVLGCWCAPDPCHADVLARLARVRGLAARLDLLTVIRTEALARAEAACG